jgi:hypothetical protein
MTTSAAQINNIVFRPSEHDTWPAFEKALSKSFREAARSSRDLSILGPLSPEQQSILETIERNWRKENLRYSDSIQPEVSATYIGHDKTEKRCKLERHFRNLLKEFVSYLDHMASKDETGERFVFANRWQKRGSKEAFVKRTEAYRLINVVESLGIAVPAVRYRNGQKKGWIIARHDDLTEVVGSMCRLINSKPKPLSPRTAGKRRYKNGAAATWGDFEEVGGDFEGISRGPWGDFEGISQGSGGDFDSLEETDNASTCEGVASKRPGAILPKASIEH